MRKTWPWVTLFVLCAVGAATLATHDALASLSRSDAPPKLRLGPRFEAGQVVRYRLESATTTESHRSGIVNDPQGPSKLTVTWSATVRMEVLAAGRDAKGQPDGSLRLRTTYEKSAANTTSDTFDPEADGIEKQYRSLEGQAFEFTLDAPGHVTNMTGFEGAAGQGSAAVAMRAWVGQLASTAGAPREGIAVGQTWVSEQAVPSSPLAGLIWRSHSEYVRNESCKPANPSGAADPLAKETCAVLLTKLGLAGSRGPGHDATPDSYKKQHMRTSGAWTGAGSSLSYVSLSTGHLVSVTQSSNEQMDFTVRSLVEERNLHYQGSVQSHTQIELVAADSK
jgi:hypothetical protein